MESQSESLPKVSVVIPVYNGAEFICDALDSVFCQNYPNMEVIVVDDCSADDTLATLHRYQNSIIIITNKSNKGASHARNQGIRHACSDLIAFLDADDIWSKDKLSRQIKLLSAHPDVGLIYGKAKLVNYINSKNIDINESIHTAGYELKSLQDIFFNPYFSTSTIVVRKKLCKDVGFFREDIKTAEDVDFVLQVASRTKIISVDAVLSLTRRVENSLGSLDSSYKENLQVVKDFLKQHPGFAYEHKALVHKITRRIYDGWLAELVNQRKINSALDIGFKSLKKCTPSKKTVFLLFKAVLLRFIPCNFLIYQQFDFNYVSKALNHFS